MTPAMSTVSLYLLLGLGVLVGLFFVGLVLGLGMWFGHGYWQARVDRKLQAEWQRWYALHDNGRKEP